jgi:hypothetical protein
VVRKETARLEMVNLLRTKIEKKETWGQGTVRRNTFVNIRGRREKLLI